MSEQTSKTHTDSAHLLRAIERGIVYDRLPAPTAVNIQPEYGSAKLRFATAEDVHEWAQLTGATIVTGPYVYREGTDSPWHEFGTEQGGKDGELGGWRVGMWASVDGLPPEPEQDWYFTFGSGHTHPESPAVNAEGGESLADRYVVIRGTFESARAIMLRFFGRVWCDQYETAEKAGVERFGLTELHRRHWPTPAADEGATSGPKPTCLNLLDADNPCSNPPAPDAIFCADCIASGRDGSAPQDGHVFACCGKTGRISPHKSWCEMNKSATADDAQSGR